MPAPETYFPIGPVDGEEGALWVATQQSKELLVLRADDTSESVAALPMAERARPVLGSVIQVAGGPVVDVRDADTNERQLWQWAGSAFEPIPLPDTEGASTMTLRRDTEGALWSDIADTTGGSFVYTPARYDGDGTWTVWANGQWLLHDPVITEDGGAIALFEGIRHGGPTSGTAMHSAGSVVVLRGDTWSTEPLPVPDDYPPEEQTIWYRSLGVVPVGGGIGVVGAESASFANESLNPKIRNSLTLHEWTGSGFRRRQVLHERARCGSCGTFDSFTWLGVLASGHFVVGFSASEHDRDPTELYIGR